MKVIAWDNPVDGSAQITTPAPAARFEGEEDEAFLLRVADETLPVGTEFDLVELSALPSDRTFRNAWERTGGNVAVNMPKARGQKMDDIRKQRNAALEAQDKELQKAEDDNDNQAKGRVGQKRKKLRDLPADIAAEVDAITDPDVLRDYVPTELQEGV